MENSTIAQRIGTAFDSSPRSLSMDILIDEGHLKVTVGKTFALSEVRQAHEYGHGRGRIVLQITDESEDTFATE